MNATFACNVVYVVVCWPVDQCVKAVKCSKLKSCPDFLSSEFILWRGGKKEFERMMNVDDLKGIK